MKINCIAIDDEPLALDKIREYIIRIGYLNLLSTFENAVDALEFLKENQVDLIFLDIQMEELTGIQMLETLQVKPSPFHFSGFFRHVKKSTNKLIRKIT